MERLTKRTEQGEVYTGSLLKYYNYQDYQVVLKCLADYEDKDTPMPVKRFDNYYDYAKHTWWVGCCPRCGKLIEYNFQDDNRDNRKQYCFRCGQLCDFEDV